MIHDILRENSRTSLNTVLLKVKAVHSFQMLRPPSPSITFYIPKTRILIQCCGDLKTGTENLLDIAWKQNLLFGFPNSIKSYFVDWYLYTHKSLRFEILS